jgi:hypothetical protein
MANERSREKLNKLVEEEVTKLFESVLDYAQVACPTPDTYKVLRSKVLRVGNNCIRTIKRKLDHYDVEYKATSEDFIEVIQR